jgi:hypothetical protein
MYRSGILGIIFNDLSSMSTTTEGADLFESLPYYDDDLQKYPHLAALVDKELARELRASQTLHPNVPPLVEPHIVSDRVFFSC